MSVQLGVLKDVPGIDNGDIEVDADTYHGVWMRLTQGNDEIILLKEHLPLLSKLIDEFLDT